MRSSFWVVGVLVLFAGAAQGAERVLVAVASNFADTARALVVDFEKQHGVAIAITSGSTGKLFAQIGNGAPFHVFLAADAAHPLRLEEAGLAVAGTRATYAVGRLALFSRSLGGVAEGALLRSEGLKHLAIANPTTAPYGTAAVEVLQALGVWDVVKDRVVYGENIAQTFQFVDAGAAEAGLVAYAQVIGRPAGEYWLVPESFHAELRQDAVLLKPGKDVQAARDFFAYLCGPAARKIIAAAGYALPDVGG